MGGLASSLGDKSLSWLMNHAVCWQLGTAIVATGLTWATASVGAESSHWPTVDRQVECEVLVVGGGLGWDCNCL